jgi:hypothetical protein
MPIHDVRLNRYGDIGYGDIGYGDIGFGRLGDYGARADNTGKNEAQENSAVTHGLPL